MSITKSDIDGGIDIISREISPLKFKAMANLAAAIAVLSGSLLTATQVEAAFNIPTAQVDPITGVAKPEPSPLCINGQCADEFTAKMLMFEEFGTKDASGMNSAQLTPAVLPPVSDCQSMPEGAALDAFLNEDINSIPGRVVDETLPNPWQAKINDCLGATTATVAEGRPGGEWFAHQRFDEFPTQRYFQSAQTGARDNGGLRNKYQMHNYAKGEFGPNGLYYRVGTDGKPGTTGLQIKIHPNLPVQEPNSVWTFDGTLPPKLLMARYGEPLIFRHYNALPIDITANNGFGRHTITTHEHNGHNPAESDGFAHAYSYPGQFYDYHWPMVLAGHDTINKGALDPKTGAPDGSGGIIKVPGDWHETMSTHWFHDHMLDYTAQNVYKGNAAMMNYYSAIDNGREPVNLSEATNGQKSTADSIKPAYACHYANPNNVSLCLPSGSGLDWGNRDYDVNLVVADKAWDANGQLKFNIFNLDGFLGDRITVNWEYKPYLDVRPRRYRFRILDGSVSRDFKIAVVKETTSAISGAKSYTKIPYYMVANDGNIMQHAVPFPNAQSLDALPEIAIGERYDIVVDFAGMAKGTKLYLVNVMEHNDGKGPSNIIPLVDVLGIVNGVTTKKPYTADGIKGDPGIGKFLEFRVGDPATQKSGAVTASNPALVDYSMNPADYQETVSKTTIAIDPKTKKTVTTTLAVPGKQMIPLNKPTAIELKNAVHRTFEFGRSNGTDLVPWTIKTDNSSGGGLGADEHRVSAAPVQGAVEIWHITDGGLGWTHPVHAHFEEGQILKRGGVAPPIWEKYARKDLYRVGPMVDSTHSVDIAIRFRDFAGTYVEHCHNTQHEDHAMLLRWDLELPGQTMAIPTPMPDWNGVAYEPSIYLPTAKTGDVIAKSKFVLPR